MPCALCLKESVLLHSHIVPEFLHRRLYDDRHRTLIVGIKRRTKVIQKGVRERLLCSDCEGRLQRYEDYFSRLWYQDRPVPSCADGEIFNLENVDYARFKLFILSIVWRAGVSTSSEFESTNLGPHADRIRRMLLSDDAGAESEYPVMGGLIIDPDSGMLWDKLLLVPATIRVARHWAVRMVFAGVSWTVLTSSHRAPDLTPLFLKEDGTMPMLALSWRKSADVSRLVEVVHKTEAPNLR